MDDRPPVIVRRIKKYNKGHGGAWKVAFADFATAMMSFFLVLWLTASTTPEQREAIQGYFEDPIGFTEGGSPNPVDLGGSASVTQQSSQDKVPDDITFEDEVIEDMAENIEERRLMELMQSIQQQINESDKLKDFKDQLLLDITDEGLRIQIVDKSKRPMFDSGKSELKFYSEAILFELASTIARVPNKLSVTGHTDAQPFAIGDEYSNWELSADRANAARRALVEGGVSADQVSRVVGLASSVLLDEADPLSPANRRIAIIILNKRSENQIHRNAAGHDAKAEQEAEKSLQDGSWFDDVNSAPLTPNEVNW
ncbi:MAG: flagellar motor protein MotB [Hahellaceae bacterium]|jgi:chemotaxis protein MotB|nr:flagellar motor protein MotB [Hahellaceae bacterium]MCP5211145.1 flagellar motor protein MotB [Hahellaceae bacterium]